MRVTGLAPRVSLAPPTKSGVRTVDFLSLSVGDGAGKSAQREYALRLDLSGLKGVLEIYEAPGCDLTADLATCRVKVTDPDRVPRVSLQLRAAAGSEEGDSGVLRVTGAADGSPLKPAAATVEVGGARLVATGDRLSTGLKVGDTAQIPVGLRNAGTAPASGVLMTFAFTEGSVPARRFDNCEYSERSSFWDKNFVLCSFDTDVPVGGEFRLPDEATFDVGTAAYHELVSVDVYADAPGMREYLRGRHSYERGSGATLELSAGESGRTWSGNDWTDSYYVAGGTADLSVTGAEISGQVGDEVVADLGLRNNGPSWLGRIEDPTEFASLEIELPDGVTVVDLPKGCAAGASYYRCQLESLASDADLSFPFKLKVEKELDDTQGQVRVVQAEWSGYDKNASNDSAPIDFTLTTTTPSPDASTSASASASASATPGEDGATDGATPTATSTSGTTDTGDGSTDGDLASTGAGTALWAAALAALLIGGGFAARTIARKRRA